MLTPINNERYISIKADGRFHEKVEEGREGAILREYELRDGTKGSKWELLYKSIDNVFIKSIRFEDSDYGENILTTLSDGENEIVWAESTASNFGSDYMKKLPNLNFSEKVSIKPYAFEDENGKDRRGVGVYQHDKIANFFFDPELKKNIKGFPEPENREDMSKDDWKVYFIQVKKFLTNYTKESILPIFENVITPEELKANREGFEYPAEEIGQSPF